MKKSLSLLLTFALVFGLFANMASAAETPASAGKYLFDAGVIKGNGTDLLLEDTWKRQDLAVLLSRLLGVEPEAKATEKSHTFNDVRGTFYDGYISWAKEKGYMEGSSETKFGFDQLLNNQSFAAVVLRALGVDTTGENYAKVPELAVAAGIVPADTDWSAPAKRGETYVALYTALDTVVGETGRKLGEILGLPGFEVTVLGLGKVEQTGAKKITVNFNRALNEEEEKEVKATVTKGTIPYTVTAKASEDKRSVVLEATYLPAGEYDVKVNEFDAVKVTVVAEIATKVDIGATVLQVTYASEYQDLKVKVLNQFEEEVKTVTPTITAFSSEKGDLASKLSNGKIDLSGEKVDNTVVVTAYTNTGLTNTKSFKLIAESSATTIQLGQVAPLKDKIRITAGEEGLVIPYTLADQYGTSIKLQARTALLTPVVQTVTIGNINFVSSNQNIINANSFKVDSDGVLSFKAGPDAGTVVITAVNSKTGASGTTTVKVEAAKSLRTLQLQDPGVQVVKGEKVVVPYVAVDTFGEPIAKADVPAAAAAAGIKFTANATDIPSSDIRWKANGDLEITFNGAVGNNQIMVWSTAHPEYAIISQISVNVLAESFPVSIEGTTGLKTTLAVDGQQDLTLGKLVVRDNYGRTMTAADLTAKSWSVAYTIESGNSNVTVATDKITGVAAGAATIKATLSKTGETSLTRDIAFTVIGKSDVKTVEVGTIGTVYASNAVGDHSVELTLVGKTAGNVEVAIDQNDGSYLVTSSNPGIAVVEASGLKIHGVAAGTTKVVLWQNGTKLFEQDVTVSNAAPIATTVSFTDAETTLTGTAGATVPLIGKVAVKDQYGVTITDTGTFYSSNAGIASVNVNSGVVTKTTANNNGIVTITYITENGLSATTLVNVEGN